MKRLVSVILLFSTLALFFNNAVNRHYHKLPNGTIVEHAHPFNKTAPPEGSPFQKHHHSDLEYLILDLVYLGTLIILLSVLMLFVFREPAEQTYLLKIPVTVNPGFWRLPHLRGPPHA